MQRILVSRCLLGEPVRYDGRDAALDDAIFRRWAAEGRLVAICPEIAGGLQVPRSPAEIQGGDAQAVLIGQASIRTWEGIDVSEAFMSGAELALSEARRYGIRMAVLKEGSPSCGVERVNDGSFTGRKHAGPGLTTRVLIHHGIRVFGEDRIADAAEYLESMEGNDGE